MKDYADKIGFTPKIPGNDDIIYMMCPFLQPKTALTIQQTCAIYDARPNICRAFTCNKTNGEIQKEFTKITGGKTPAKPVNTWKIYDKTGLRKDGVEISYSDADIAQLEDDDGRKIQFQVGQPLNIACHLNKYIHNALCIKIYNDGIQVATADGIEFIHYDAIQTITV